MSSWIQFLQDDGTKGNYKTFKQLLEDEKAFNRRKSLFEKVRVFKEAQKPKGKRQIAKEVKEKPKGKRQLAKEAKERDENIRKLTQEWVDRRKEVWDRQDDLGRKGYLYYAGRIKRDVPKSVNIDERKKAYDADMESFYKAYGKDTVDFINYETGEANEKYKDRPKYVRPLWSGYEWS